MITGIATTIMKKSSMDGDI